MAGHYDLVGSTSNCRSKFESQLGHITFVEIDNEIISTVILPCPLIQEGSCQELVKVYTSTFQPLYNTVRYNMILDITQFKTGSQKCIDYIEK